MAAAYADRPRTLISRAQLSRKGGRRAYWLSLSAVVLVFSLVFLFPLYWMITGGFKPTAELVRNPPSFVPAHPQLTGR